MLSRTVVFNDIMYSGGFIPMISRPSWIAHTLVTLVDNVYSNQIIDRDHYPMGILDRCIWWLSNLPHC